jgi:hypothetical protein
MGWYLNEACNAYSQNWWVWCGPVSYRNVRNIVVPALIGGIMLSVIMVVRNSAQKKPVQEWLLMLLVFLLSLFAVSAYFAAFFAATIE